MRRLVVLVVALFLMSLGLVLSPAGAQTDPASAEAEFVSSINALRASKGLGQLAVHGELVALGRSWAGEMAKVDRISHNPNLANAVEADWQKLGENVGVGMTVSKLHQAFIDSPAHFKNLVDPDFTHIGVGVVLGRDGAIFTSHQFMKLRTAAPRPPVTTPPVTTAPKPAPTTTTAASEPEPAPAPEAAPERPATPTPLVPPLRLVLVLEQLRALDART